MMAPQPNTTEMLEFEAGIEQEVTTKRVLVVDDSRVQRRILGSSLKRWGYQVMEADSGQAALEICRTEQLDLILSDWMMPGMNGLEFCSAFREIERDSYVYFILLTSKSEKDEVAHGLDVGADDFLTKPVNASELRARIRAGERIQKMQRELSKKNRQVTDALAEIRCLYDTIDRDLIEARKLQQSLIKERYRDFGPAEVSLLLRPCGRVGGDLVGFFPISESRIGLFSIDVSGHGITSALMTARLAGFLSGATPDQNLALEHRRGSGYSARSPAMVTEHLNRIVLEEMKTEHYFTLLLAYVDLKTGEVVATQAGHPHPAVQRAGGAVEFCGKGGLPVGLIPGATYEDFRIRLSHGDRLLMMSDGITECPDETGDMLEEMGLERLMKQNTAVSGERFLEALMWDLSQFVGEQEFPDDISAVLLEYNG